MNLKKIIREEINDLQWIMDIKTYPTLQQLFDRGEIKEGDVLVLRGEVEKSNNNGEMTWTNDFTITINTKDETLDRTSFDLDPNEIEAGKAMNLSDYINVSFLKSDGNLEVIRKNNKSTQLTESEELQWIKDIEPDPMDPQKGYIYRWHGYADHTYLEDIKTDDIIILDVKDDKVYFDTVDRYWANHPDEPGSDNFIVKLFINNLESGEIEYLGTSNINESNDLDWIKDIKAGDLWTPYVGMKFIVTDGSDDVIYHILGINDEESWMELKWKDNRSGEEEYFGYYMEDYYRMVEEGRVQIVHDNLNESEEDNELQWIMDIKTNNDIAQEIYDGLEWYKEPNVSTDFVKNQWSDINFSVRPGFTEKPIISPSSFYRGFTKWAEEKWGIEKERTLDVYRKLIDLIHNKIKKPITESEDDLDWIKDINPIPELKVGSCFTDVMDPTQRKWVIIDFILTPAGTRTVIVKNNIDIKYMNLEYFEQDLFSGRYKPCQR